MTMTTTFDTLTLALPGHWLPAVINDDMSGLDESETRALTRWVQDMHREFGAFHIGATSDEFFARWHDAAEYGVPACMCVDATVVIPACA